MNRQLTKPQRRDTQSYQWQDDLHIVALLITTFGVIAALCMKLGL